MRKLVILAATAALATAGFGRTAEAWKAERDVTKAKVYVAEDATMPEIEAAKLILRAQVVIAGGADTTNVAPQVAKELPKEGIVVGWMGSALVKPLAAKFGLKPWRECQNGTDQIVQTFVGDTLVLAGNGPEGAFYAVSDFLYHNGARFLHTGGVEDDYASGLYLEYMTGLKAPRARFYEPVASIRTGFALNDLLSSSKRCTKAQFVARNMFAIFNGSTPDAKTGLTGGHSRGFFGSECIQPAYHDFDKHREWFPMNKEGKRFRPTGGWCWVFEGCWDQPDFKEWVIDRVAKLAEKAGPDNRYAFDVTNSDGGPKCLCPACQKDRAKFGDESSRYFTYKMGINEALKKRYPEMRIETLAYGMGRTYPKMGNAVLKGVDSIIFCPHARCYVHTYADENCPTCKADLKTMAEWKKANLPIGDFDYSFDLFNPAMSVPTWEHLADVVRYWKEYNGEKGVPYMFIESATSPNGNGGKSRIAAYVAARALWDDTTSADEHLADWCRVAFGPAKDVMLAYYRSAAKAWRTQKAHVFNTFNNPLGTAKSYFTKELEAQGVKAFAEAEKALKAFEAKATADRERNLVRKQLATLAFEKKMFAEWQALAEKANKTSIQVNLEEGDATWEAFDRIPKVMLKARAWWGNYDDPTKSTVQCYRTKDALRLKFDMKGGLFKPAPWKEAHNDNDRAYTEDGVEIFVRAPGKSDYYHIAINKFGDIYDGCALDKSFTSSDLKLEQKQEDGRFQLVVTLPYGMFGLDEVKDGDIFKLVAVCNLSVLGEPDKKTGERKPTKLMVGLPYPAHHDIAAGADLRVDMSTGRRVGE